MKTPKRHSSLSPHLDKLNLTEVRMKRYTDEANILSSNSTLITDTENELRIKESYVFTRKSYIQNTIISNVQWKLIFALL